MAYFLCCGKISQLILIPSTFATIKTMHTITIMSKHIKIMSPFTMRSRQKEEQTLLSFPKHPSEKDPSPKILIKFN